MGKYSKDDVAMAPAPSEGVHVYGLYLEGAAWDRKNNRLYEARPKVLNDSLPVVHIYAINIANAPQVENPKLYSCPVYKKPRRADLTYIAALNLRTAVNAEHWTLRGVALL